jgi:hypothetical protein
VMTFGHGELQAQLMAPDSWAGWEALTYV